MDGRAARRQPLRSASGSCLRARPAERSIAVRKVMLRLEELEDRTVPTLLGQQLFPGDNPWNQQITNAPVAASSAAVINNVITSYGNGRLHPDVGQDYRNGNPLYGI